MSRRGQRLARLEALQPLGGGGGAPPAPNVPSAQNDGPLTGNTVSQPVNVTRTESGQYIVTGTISGTDSTSELVSVYLTKDGTKFSPVMVVETVLAGPPNSWWGSMTWVDVAADASPHAYAVVAKGASGTLTVPTSQAAIVVAEIA